MTPRVVKLRSQKPICLIVTEGETEQKYFEGLRGKCPKKLASRIHVKNPNDTDMTSLTKYCCDQIREMDLDIERKDRIFCVMDYPGNAEKVIPKNMKKVKKNQIELILSRPCFELWFLLHFKRVSSSMDENEIIRQLRKYIPNYKKADNRIYSRLEDKTRTAISNGERTRIIDPREIKNPYTNVQELVISIYGLIEQEE